MHILHSEACLSLPLLLSNGGCCWSSRQSAARMHVFPHRLVVSTYSFLAINFRSICACVWKHCDFYLCGKIISIQRRSVSHLLYLGKVLSEDVHWKKLSGWKVNWNGGHLEAMQDFFVVVTVKQVCHFSGQISWDGKQSEWSWNDSLTLWPTWKWRVGLHA